MLQQITQTDVFFTAMEFVLALLLDDDAEKRLASLCSESPSFLSTNNRMVTQPDLRGRRNHE